MSGWQTTTAGLRDYGDLPAKARQYLERLAELVGVEFCLVSTGAVRDDTILMADSPLVRWFPSLRGSIPPRP
jgi:adenylosuccinate synthase